MNPVDFYPTPTKLAGKLIAGLRLDGRSHVLDVGAGTGVLSECLLKMTERQGYRRRHYSNNGSPQIDAIEPDGNLQAILKSKGFRVIHDNFLTFQTNFHYDVIIANFPFSLGAECLHRALDLIERNGGELRCIVNAETVRNPFTRLRTAVAERLKRLGAKIVYHQGAFKDAERPTEVEVATIQVAAKAPEVVSFIFEDMQKAAQFEGREFNPQELVTSDVIGAAVAQFNQEAQMAIRFLGEYFALKPYMRDTLDCPKSGGTDYSSPLISLEVDGRSADRAGKSELTNRYLCGLRKKYWRAFIEGDGFRGQYTSNILKELDGKLNALIGYDFTEFNIRELQEELGSKIVAGAEQAILDLFDSFSRKYSYGKDFGNNLHYYNGWMRNKAHKVNHKIVMPINGHSSYSYLKGKLDDYHLHEKLTDTVKVFQYLSGEGDEDASAFVSEALRRANHLGKTALNLGYFSVKYFKKGTAHITFLRPDLLEKLNIFGSQRKNWLPPCYGKKRYEDMEPEDKAVIDEFQGREAYEQVFANPEKFILATDQLLLGS